ncbi:MAG: hypothetical protein ACRDPL_01980, partial [Propionibacteriaceae bacterium]
DQIRQSKPRSRQNQLRIMNQNNIVIPAQRPQDRAGRPPRADSAFAGGPGDIDTPQTAATWKRRQSWWNVESEGVKRRDIGHVPLGSQQGRELALPNP